MDTFFLAEKEAASYGWEGRTVIKCHARYARGASELDSLGRSTQGQNPHVGHSQKDIPGLGTRTIESRR